MRLDRAVVERGLVRSRTHAQELITAGLVRVSGTVEAKPGRDVADEALITLDDSAREYVSRAAHKLLGALDAFGPLGLNVMGVTALDAGASTGGFTEVLLERGAAHVTAVDVGHGQLAPALASDQRVTAVEGLNVRFLDENSPGAGASLVVADLSFISLTTVISALVRCAHDTADFVLMIKPQFELNRAALDKHGVVLKAADRAAAVMRVRDELAAHGLGAIALERSVLPGPSGNVEFFIWARRAWQAKGVTVHEPMSDEAFAARLANLVKGAP